MADLTIVLGATVTVTVTGHSAINGAPIPSGSAVVLASSDPTIATVPAIAVLTADAPSVAAPATILASGSTTISAVVNGADGTPLKGVAPGSATLIVTPAIAGLTHVSVDLSTP